MEVIPSGLLGRGFLTVLICMYLVPGVVVSIMEGELHHPNRPQLDAGPQELASQLSIPNDVPLSAFSICCHNSRVMNDLWACSRLRMRRTSQPHEAAV